MAFRCNTTFSTMRVHAALLFTLIAAALIACAFAFPMQAYATFKDAADSYPAMQDLGSYGSPIDGSQLPDGMYKIGARTSSRMCIMYTNPADAEARDSKEQAVLSVSGGSMTVLFYISKAYTHLYWGTQEEAAAATNEDGTDASAYIAGDPDEGYTPHMFALPISTLNEPMTISTYSGGDKGLKAGKWYTREVVFTMTDAELQEAIAGGQQEEQAEEERKQKEAEEAAAAAAAAAKEQEAQAQAQSAATQTSSDSGDDQEQAAEPEPQQEPAPGPEPQQVVENTVRGTLLKIDSPEVPLTMPVPETEEAPEPRQTFPTTLVVVVAAFAIAFAAGMGLRALLFARSKK